MLLLVLVLVIVSLSLIVNNSILIAHTKTLKLKVNDLIIIIDYLRCLDFQFHQ